jgi:hypothetical protein
MPASPPPPPPDEPPPRFDPRDQAVFDVVTGPNLRKRDNFIQAFCILGGLVIGALGAPVFGWAAGSRGQDLVGWALAGAFGGVVVMLLVSGTVLGLYRAYTAGKPR